MAATLWFTQYGHEPQELSFPGNTMHERLLGKTCNVGYTVPNVWPIVAREYVKAQRVTTAEATLYGLPYDPGPQFMIVHNGVVLVVGDGTEIEAHMLVGHVNVQVALPLCADGSSVRCTLALDRPTQTDRGVYFQLTSDDAVVYAACWIHGAALSMLPPQVSDRIAGV
jgi:hypothetical protein